MIASLTPGAPLSRAEAAHYSRHLMLPEIGLDGQRRLKGARVLLVGAGGLGSPAGLYLAAAGVGTIGIVEFDVIEASNLQRQILYTSADVGRPKAEVAAARLRAMNPHIEVVVHDVRLQRDNAVALFGDYDVVLDGTDNFATRYLINDACVLSGRPYVHASVYRFEGQLTVFGVPGGPCYRCLYPAAPPPGFAPSCAEAGVLGVLPGLLGTMQAAEAIKLITGVGRPLVDRLLRLDMLEMRTRELRIGRDPECVICGDQASQSDLVDYLEFCGVRPAAADDVPTVTPAWLDARLRAGDDLQVVDVREPHEFDIVRIAGARLIPLGTLAEAADGLAADVPVVCYCKSGARSQTAVGVLRAHGLTDVVSLAGGITAWARDVAPEALVY